MGKILIPATDPEEWKRLLAKPGEQWRRGYSARTLAYCWQEADGLPESGKDVLEQQPQFSDLEVLLVIPEHQVSLRGGSRPSQSDLWVLARSGAGLVSIAVEGKVAEPFGETVSEWLQDASEGKRDRLAFLCNQLGLEPLIPGDIRYQLLHRTASAVIEAGRFGANRAMMLVHSFSPTDQWFEDYERFVSLFRRTASPNKVVEAGNRAGRELYFAWIRGEQRYLGA